MNTLSIDIPINIALREVSEGRVGQKSIKAKLILFTQIKSPEAGSARSGTDILFVDEIYESNYYLKFTN